MKVARNPGELELRPRAVAIGTFDGVHLGHRAVLAAAQAAGLLATAVTFEPHPRIAFGYEVELLTTLERRLELIGEAGISEAWSSSSTTRSPSRAPRSSWSGSCARSEPRSWWPGATSASARAARATSRRCAGSASTRARSRSSRACPRAGSAISCAAARSSARRRLLGRPPELDGLVVAGDARGDTLGFPTANLQVDPRLLVPAYGIYAGAALDHRAAISIGTNPHYEGTERRVEAHLLDFDGDLYGERLVVQLWRRLRDEAQFESEEELVAQIARDVEETRAAEPPA